MTVKYRWTARLSLLTPLLLFVAVLLMGGGHGWFEPAMFLFPLGTLNTIWQDHFSLPFIVLAFIQFPLYGFIVDKSKQHGKGQWMIFLILFLHILLATLILIFRQPDWT